MLLYASALLNPGHKPVLEPALWVHGDTLAYVGPASELPEAAERDPQTIDLGEMLLCPGLVNAHAHLELTAMAGLPYPGEFVAWIREILEAKARTEIAEQDRGLHEGILQGLRGGTTCIGDHVSIGANLEALLRSPLRGRAFLEVLGVVPEIARDMLAAALLLRDSTASLAKRISVTPSPHSVHALAINTLSETLALPEPLFSIHLAESQAEADYFAEASGPMQELLASRALAPRRETRSAIRELDRLGRLDSRILAVHGNYLDEAELRLIANRGISLVHCPFSHGYFGHGPFPMESARNAGVNVALGTDSLASAATLSMLEVLQEMRRQFPALSREDIFAMATLGGAKALKLDKDCGSLEAGKKADLIGIPYGEGASPIDALFQADRVETILINGDFVTGF